MRDRILENIRTSCARLILYRKTVQTMYSRLSSLKSTITAKRNDWITATGLKDVADVVVQKELEDRRILITHLQVVEAKIRNCKQAIRALNKVLTTDDSKNNRRLP